MPDDSIGLDDLDIDSQGSLRRPSSTYVKASTPSPMASDGPQAAKKNDVNPLVVPSAAENNTAMIEVIERPSESSTVTYSSASKVIDAPRRKSVDFKAEKPLEGLRFEQMSMDGEEGKELESTSPVSSKSSKSADTSSSTSRRVCMSDQTRKMLRQLTEPPRLLAIFFVTCAVTVGLGFLVYYFVTARRQRASKSEMNEAQRLIQSIAASIQHQVLGLLTALYSIEGFIFGEIPPLLTLSEAFDYARNQFSRIDDNSFSAHFTSTVSEFSGFRLQSIIKGDNVMQSYPPEAAAQYIGSDGTSVNDTRIPRSFRDRLRASAYLQRDKYSVECLNGMLLLGLSVAIGNFLNYWGFVFAVADPAGMFTTHYTYTQKYPIQLVASGARDGSEPTNGLANFPGIDNPVFVHDGVAPLRDAGVKVHLEASKIINVTASQKWIVNLYVINPVAHELEGGEIVAIFLCTFACSLVFTVVIFLMRLVSAERKEAEYAIEAQGEIAGFIYHEVRNPSQAITYALEAAPEAVREEWVDFNRVSQATCDITKLLDTALDLLKCESGKLALAEFTVVDTSALIDEVISQVQKTMPYGKELEWTVYNSVPDYIWTDPFRLAQLWAGVIRNAGVHCRTKATVSFVAENNVISTIVQDDGDSVGSFKPGTTEAFAVVSSSIGRFHGVSGVQLLFAHRLAKVFGGSVAFVQLKHSASLGHKTRKVQRHIANREKSDKHKHRSNGKISGGGEIVTILGDDPRIWKPKAEMIITVPFTVASEAEYTKQAQSEEKLAESVLRSPRNEEDAARIAEQLQHAKVLVVDDTVINLKLTKKLLSMSGLQEENIFVAESGFDALKQFEASMRGGSKRFDVIFLDLYMPEMDGVQTAMALREAEGRHMVDRVLATRLIMLSGSCLKEDRERAFRNGVDAFHSKPCPKGKLIGEISVALAKRAVAG